MEAFPTRNWDGRGTLRLFNLVAKEIAMSQGRTWKNPLTALAVVVLIAGNARKTFAIPPAESLVYSFQGGADGSLPYGALVADAHGSLYGTTNSGGTYGFGTIFKVAPPTDAHGSWKETVLYEFQGSAAGDGASPYSGLILDHAGNLYGTTLFGGNQTICPDCGVVFKLTRPTSPQGAWTESVLWSFGAPGDGIFPFGTLTMDPRGNLYGTTYLGGSLLFGAVFELTPPGKSGSWNEQILYSFGEGTSDGLAPASGVTRNPNGTLYGTTVQGGAYGLGTVYELTESKSAWSETVLYSFTGGGDGGEPFSGVILDDQGRLDGTASAGGYPYCAGGCGTVYQLIPPSSRGAAWNISVLYAFTGGGDGGGPIGGVVSDSGGTLLGTASEGGNANCPGGCGTVYELTRAPHQSAWTENTLYQFAGGTTDGASPVASLLLTDGNDAFGLTETGGASDAGTLFRIKLH